MADKRAVGDKFLDALRRSSSSSSSPVVVRNRTSRDDDDHGNEGMAHVPCRHDMSLGALGEPGDQEVMSPGGKLMYIGHRSSLGCRIEIVRHPEAAPRGVSSRGALGRSLSLHSACPYGLTLPCAILLYAVLGSDRAQ